MSVRDAGDANDGEALFSVSGSVPGVAALGVPSLDNPCNACRLPYTSLLDSWMSELLRKAGEPIPLSLVCRNHEGSLAPRFLDMTSLERVRSGSAPASVGSSDACKDDARSSIDVGRLWAPRTDAGRCCHDRVPDREGTVKELGTGLGGCGGLALKSTPGLI